MNQESTDAVVNFLAKVNDEVAVSFPHYRRHGKVEFEYILIWYYDKGDTFKVWLRSDGTIYCWSYNSVSEIRIEPISKKETPSNEELFDGFIKQLKFIALKELMSV